MAYGYKPRRFFGRKKTNPKKKTVTRSKAVRQVRRTNFNRRVLAVVNRNSETKMKTINIADNHMIYGQGLLSTSQNQGSGHAGYLVPNLLDTNILGIASGTEQEQKVGNKIRNAKVVVSGVIKSLPYSTNNPYISPFEVHMVCFKSKNDKDGSPLQLKSKDNNTLGTCDGSLENTLYPYNKEKYIIHKVRVFKLRGYGKEFSSTNSGAEITPVGGQAANLPAFVRFRCECPISNTLTYQDGYSVPSNSWCALGFYVVDGMNNTIQNTHHRASLFLEGKITFKDD